jgi:YD repeat-containing protein
MTSTPIKLFPLYAMILLLHGCGGGGGSSNNGGNGSNDNGRVIVDGHELNPDFAAEHKDYYAKISYFDSDGKLTSQHDIYEWQGQEPTYAYDFRYSYDSNGILQSREHEFTYTREGLALWNHLYGTTSYSYNAQDQLSSESEVVDKFDNDADGIYDDNDGIGTYAGAVRYSATYTYDANDRLINKIHDDDGDGNLSGSSADEQISYEYDSSGNLIRQTIYDGIGITTTLVNSYNSSNQLTHQERFPTLTRYNADDPDMTTEFFYDGDGNLIRKEIDSGEYHTSIRTLDGNADTIIRYSYGISGEATEKSTEEIYSTFSRMDKVQYLHEVIDVDTDGTPESTITYVYWLDTVYDNTGGGYPADSLPSWVQNAQTNINNGNNSDGWGLNWEGHGSTCSTCGNMIGEVNRILYGF